VPAIGADEGIIILERTLGVPGTSRSTLMDVPSRKRRIFARICWSEPITLELLMTARAAPRGAGLEFVHGLQWPRAKQTPSGKKFAKVKTSR